MEKTKFFVNRNLQSDTTGNLDLSVRLAQSSIVLGKKNQVAGDEQPHLVAQRNTLMLCKPLNNSVAKGDSIEVLVYDKDNRLTYSSKDVSASNVPDIMGNISINANVVDSDFVEPSTYDYIIYKQAELNTMKNDKTGAYLDSLLKQYNTIKIITSNGNWIGEFYLPNTLLTNQMITFHCNSGYGIRVYSNISSLSSYYAGGTKAIYRNEIIQFQWNLEGSVHYTHIYGYIISTQAELNKMKDDKTGAYLDSLLKQYNKIKIITSDGNWIPDFYLPNIWVPNSKLDKVITFECKSSYSFSVYRLINGSYVKVNFNNGQKATFINQKLLNNGWVTLDDYKFSQIGYMQDALACTLPYSCINPGMRLEFKYQDKKSTLNDIEIGGFSEVIINTIDIGLLTPNRNQFTIQKDYELQRQYFQSIPASRLIFNEYAPVHLTEVMLPNGTLLKTCDPSRADVYDGEMNASVAHLLFSFGINKANNGQNESLDNRFSYSYFTPMITTINSVGMYCSDGRVVHGFHAYINGSANLIDSVGNEWSHEIGHCYNLSHYPNGANGSIHRPDGDINSSWGWDCNLNKFIPNFEKNITNAESCYDDGRAVVVHTINNNGDVVVMECGCVDHNEDRISNNADIQNRIKVCIPPFEGRKFNWDAMAGGEPQYSNYTLHTPYVLNHIQNFFERKAMFDRASSTGFSKWNATTKTMEPVNNIVNGKIRKPLEQGVPVVTLLGYVNPSAKTAYIYKPLIGAYGMVYEALDTNSSGYYIQVKYNKLGKVYTLYYQLSSTNFSAGYSNMFHINIKRDFEVAEYNVKIYLNNSLIQEKILVVPTGELKYYVHGKPLNE